VTDTLVLVPDPHETDAGTTSVSIFAVPDAATVVVVEDDGDDDLELEQPVAASSTRAAPTNHVTRGCARLRNVSGATS
jgi:hypothetical protein